MHAFAHGSIIAGNFLFHYRNGLFPAIIVLLLLGTRPQTLFTDPDAQSLWIGFGALVALLGEGVRLLTIGYDYIDRGGREGKVYASRLVKGGIYAHVRNPMYLGNILIATGLVIYSSSLLALATALPFFLFTYYSIIAAEEAYLSKSFGAEYDAYRKNVPSLWPRFTGLIARLSGERYDWKRALRKDYGNMFLIAMCCIILSWWQVYYLESPEDAWQMAPHFSSLILAAALPYFTVMRLKKTHRLG